MISTSDTGLLRLALPKGRMATGVEALLRECGIEVRTTARNYRPDVSLPDFEAKILKPQAVTQMVAAGSRDLGFAGADWVCELGANVVELLDTELDPVSLVAAAPSKLAGMNLSQTSGMVIASEYERLTRCWMEERGIRGQFLNSFGATEVYPPEDADIIVDNMATGATLRANDLAIVDELMKSSTRLYACPRSLEIPQKRERIENFVVLLRSVLEARKRVMLELNVTRASLEAVVAILPCMKQPTISPLFRGACQEANSPELDGFAIKVAVPKPQVPGLIPRIRAAGGTDIVVTTLTQIIP